MGEPTGWVERLVSIADQGLRVVAAQAAARRPSPALDVEEQALSADERATSAALMRVNRAGEISAQALYLGQALCARSPETRRHLLEAAAEERDHLVWCSDRLAELGGRRSFLDPFWYAGSTCIGMIAGVVGDRLSLGFVGETEKQVEAHLDDHLRRLPAGDLKSRAILTRMVDDETHHGRMATLAGGRTLPAPVRRVMSLGGGLLRRLAYVL